MHALTMRILFVLPFLAPCPPPSEAVLRHIPECKGHRLFFDKDPQSSQLDSYSSDQVMEAIDRYNKHRLWLRLKRDGILGKMSERRDVSTAWNGRNHL